MPKKWRRAVAVPLIAIAAGAALAPAADARTHRVHSRHGKVCHRHDHKLRGRRTHCVKPGHGRVRAHFRKDHRTRIRYHRIRLHKAHMRALRQAQHSNAWVLPRYVVMCESGGNPRIVNRTAAGAANGYPAGLYQITGPTWRAMGGLRFAYSADQASVYQQGLIAKRVLAVQGPRAWACW